MKLRSECPLKNELADHRDAEIAAAVARIMNKISNGDEAKKAATEGELEEHAVAETEALERGTNSLGRRLWDCLVLC